MAIRSKLKGRPVTAAEVATLRGQLRAAQQGASAPYRLVLAWAAGRAAAYAAATGGPPEAITSAALRLLHRLLRTYDPARDPVGWVDGIILHAARCAAATRPAMTDARGGAAHDIRGGQTP